MTTLIPATIAIIDKGSHGCPLYIKSMNVDYRLLWRYFMSDDSRLLESIKSVLGIDPNSPIFSAVFTDYLISPITGEVLEEDSVSFDEFMNTVLEKHIELINHEAPVIVLMA